MNTKLSMQQLESQINTFNRAYKVGDKVEVYKSLYEEEIFIDEIKNEATIIGGHTAMTWLKGKGSYDLTFVKGLKLKKEDNQLIEQLADKQHEIWAHWMKYQFSKCVIEEKLSRNHYTNQDEFIKTGNLIIPKESVERWTRQMNTNYKDLTEREKESDREQVRKFKGLL